MCNNLCKCLISVFALSLFKTLRIFFSPIAVQYFNAILVSKFGNVICQFLKNNWPVFRIIVRCSLVKELSCLALKTGGGKRWGSVLKQDIFTSEVILLCRRHKVSP